MTKEKYLEDLYQSLQKYEADSTLKHVTEYDYLISDMLEDSSIEEVIEKLGSSEDLAKSIAEEFGYELKKSNQFEDPIINRQKDYSNRNSYDLVAKIINIIFIIASIIFFLSFGISVLGALAAIFIFGLFGLSSTFWVLAVIAFSVFVFAIYMLVLNLKNLLVNRLVGDNQTTVSEVN